MGIDAAQVRTPGPGLASSRAGVLPVPGILPDKGLASNICVLGTGPGHARCSVSTVTSSQAQGLDRPAVAVDDPSRYHLPERLPVLGFSLHGRAQQDNVLDDPLAIWRETPEMTVSTPGHSGS